MNDYDEITTLDRAESIIYSRISGDGFDYLCKLVDSVCVKLESALFLYTFPSCNEFDIDSKRLDDCTKQNVDIWLELSEQEVINFFYDKKPIKTFQIDVDHPQKDTIIALVQKMFGIEGKRSTPDKDREHLVYLPLFNSVKPEVIWDKNDLGIRVLKYKKGYEKADVYVTSGFSNPGLGPAPIESDYHTISGFGYELIMYALPEDSVLENIFIESVIYILESGRHLLRDNWMRFPTTEKLELGDIAGLIVVSPKDLPEYFAVGDGIAYWNLLLGVTDEELKMAETTETVEHVVKLLNDKNRDDVTRRVIQH